MSEIILPGTYIKVFDEGLISAGAISSGNIGIVGTANKGPVGEVQIIGSLSEAQEIFGSSGNWVDGKSNELTLMRSLQQIYSNGGKTVYAVRIAKSAKAAELILKSTNKSLLKITAKTPGTWANGIEVSIKDDNLTITAGLLREKIKIGDTIAALTTLINDSSAIVSAETMSEGTLKEITEAKLADGTNGNAAGSTDYAKGLQALENEIVNIVVLAGQDSSQASVLQAHLNITKEIKRERIGIIGADSNDVAKVSAHTVNDDRMILVAPGIKSVEVNSDSGKESAVDLPASYTAAAIAGMISSLPVQVSPTNKVLTIKALSENYSSSKLEKLVQSRVLAVEKREGFRLVKGITTATNSAWHQITTRRIVDYAVYGVRSACNPYIGKLNNERVRSALKATIDGFLTRMVNDEALTGYELQVSATRQQEIAGEVMVTMTLQPTFSIDFIKVNMYLS